jgi:hypothetical protein
MLLIVFLLMTSSSYGLNTDRTLDIVIAVKEKLNSGSVYLLRNLEPGEYQATDQKLYPSTMFTKVWVVFQTISRVIILCFDCRSVGRQHLLYLITDHDSISRNSALLSSG